LPDAIEKVRLCALLHDIGKPECWANRRSWSDHINWTYNIVKESFGETCAVIALRHHTGRSYPVECHPKTDLEKVICLADNLASGADRREEPDAFSPHPNPPFHLTHILSDGKQRNVLDEAALAYASRILRDKLKEIGAKWETSPRESYDRVFSLLLSSGLVDIPADTRSPINDVSLWDHLKLTAAFSTCIWLDGGYRGDDLDDYEFALVSGDADKISRFVNLSSRLPDLNARSERIKASTDAAGARIAELLGRECLIFVGGGGILALSPASMAEEVSSAVEEAFESVTQKLVAMTVNYVRSDGRRMQRGFGDVWKEAQRQMRMRKYEKPLALSESLPDEIQVCDVCHVRPFVHEDSGKVLPFDASPRPERLCEFCWRLRKEGHGVRLDQLRQRSNYVALVRADGDNMGKVLGGERFGVFGKALTPSRLSTISRQIHGICEDKLRNIVERAHGRCLIAGGDDILAIVSGEEALETARNISVQFRDELAQACTMSAGVVIFRYDLPIYAGLEAVEILLHAAKESKSKDSVAFAFIGGTGLTPNEVGDVMHGPRRWSELEEIIRLSRAMSEGGVVSSKIRRVATAAMKNIVMAEVYIKSQMGKGEKGGGLSWRDGENLIYCLESGILSDAFTVYNTFKT
jgi:CRISPR/Cas system-associated protein Cas10 (large subunit of type III CRISPR-Cas system)